MSVVTLPLMIQSMVIQREGMTIYFPQIIGHWNIATQNKMNREISEMTELLIEAQYEEQDVTKFDEMIGTFEIKTNERNVLSMTFSNYAIAPFFAHGLTLMKSLTFDVNSGKTYSLQELFKQDSQFVDRISEHIKKQIKRRNIPVFEPFTHISKEQDYYIADKSLVIYFPVYAITPGYFGFPMFPISVYDLEDIVRDQSPLAKMLGN